MNFKTFTVIVCYHRLQSSWMDFFCRASYHPVCPNYCKKIPSKFDHWTSCGENLDSDLFSMAKWLEKRRFGHRWNMLQGNCLWFLWERHFHRSLADLERIRCANTSKIQCKVKLSPKLCRVSLLIDFDKLK